MANVDRITEYFRAQLFESTDEGLQVPEERREDVTRIAREMLRHIRRLRRETRMVDLQIENHADEKTVDSLDSAEAKLILLEKVKQYLSKQKFDAWPVWLEANFDSRDGKYVIKESAAEHIADLLRAADEIENEMAKDDF